MPSLFDADPVIDPTANLCVFVGYCARDGARAAQDHLRRITWRSAERPIRQLYERAYARSVDDRHSVEDKLIGPPGHDVHSADLIFECFEIARLIAAQCDEHADRSDGAGGLTWRAHAKG